jgi:diamine N-acetyltransferase
MRGADEYLRPEQTQPKLRQGDGLDSFMETKENKQKTAQDSAAVLSGPMVVLRPVGAADLPILQVWDADPAIIELMGRRFDEQSPEQWLRSLRNGRSSRAWIIEYSERPVGELELAQINYSSGTAEIRICIGEKDCWGLGLGREAMARSLAFAFETLNLKEIYLRVFATNTRAIRLYERLGFRKEAILPPSSRRQDPAPVVLMNLDRHRWAMRRQMVAVG